MRATRTFTDERENLRKNGEEWLITFDDTEAHIPGIYEEVLRLSLYHSINLLKVKLCPLPTSPVSLNEQRQ